MALKSGIMRRLRSTGRCAGCPAGSQNTAPSARWRPLVGFECLDRPFVCRADRASCRRWRVCRRGRGCGVRSRAAAMRCWSLPPARLRRMPPSASIALELVPGRFAERVGQRLDRAGAGRRDRRRNRYGFRLASDQLCVARDAAGEAVGQSVSDGVGQDGDRSPRRRQRPRSRRSSCAGCWSPDRAAVIIRHEVSAWIVAGAGRYASRLRCSRRPELAQRPDLGHRQELVLVDADAQSRYAARHRPAPGAPPRTA